MTDRLSIYNGALVVHLGETPLDALTDDVPMRYALDTVWDRSGVKSCLEMGQWNFAARSQRLEFEASVTPQFGYRHAFAKPDDYVRTMGVCSDEYFNEPLRAYTDEAGYWWADLEQLFVRFVSDDNEFGLDFAKWPQSFTLMVEAWFALQVTNVKTHPELYDRLEARHQRLLTKAQGIDAMGQPAKRMPRGSWSRARGKGVVGDIGSTSRLTG